MTMASNGKWRLLAHCLIVAWAHHCLSLNARSRSQFAHGQQELRNIQRHPKWKTELCRTFWRYGTCPYAKRCCFVSAVSDYGIAVASLTHPTLTTPDP